MAVSSYRIQNDYTPFTSLKPYELPVNEIFKSLVANTQYWQQGAMRVKSAYDNALGLDLSLDENKERSKEYFKKVDEQMKKLSGSDLANIDVQNQALKLFNPLLEDKYILQDHQNTSIYKKAITDYQSDPNKNALNLQDATGWYNDWVKDPNANSKSKDYVAKSRPYIKFYDFSKEHEDILKGCHSSKTSNSGTKDSNGLSTDDQYLFKEDREFLTSDTIEGCLSTGYSQEAKTQIGINARGLYKTADGQKDLLRLGKDYYNSGIDANYIKSIAVLEKDILIAKEYDKTNKTDNSLLINSYNNKITYYKDKIEAFAKDKAKIDNGDASFLDDSFDQLSSALYMSQFVKSYAAPRSWEKQSSTLSANAIWIQKSNVNQKSLDRKLDLKKHDDNMLNNQLDRDNRLTVAMINQNGSTNKSNGTIKYDAQGNPIGYEAPIIPGMAEGEKAVRTSYDDLKKFENDKDVESNNLITKITEEIIQIAKTNKDINPDGSLINSLNHVLNGDDRSDLNMITSFINDMDKKGLTKKSALLNNYLQQLKQTVVAKEQVTRTRDKTLATNGVTVSLNSNYGSSNGTIIGDQFSGAGDLTTVDERKYIYKNKKGEEISSEDMEKILSPVVNNFFGKSDMTGNVVEIDKLALSIFGANATKEQKALIQLETSDNKTGLTRFKLIKNDNNDYNVQELKDKLIALGYKGVSHVESKQSSKVFTYVNPDFQIMKQNDNSRNILSLMTQSFANTNNKMKAEESAFELFSNNIYDDNAYRIVPDYMGTTLQGYFVEKQAEESKGNFVSGKWYRVKDMPYTSVEKAYAAVNSGMFK